MLGTSRSDEKSRKSCFAGTPHPNLENKIFKIWMGGPSRKTRFSRFGWGVPSEKQDFQDLDGGVPAENLENLENLAFPGRGMKSNINKIFKILTPGKAR